jgi:hypothetical protein
MTVVLSVEAAIVFAAGAFAADTEDGVDGTSADAAAAVFAAELEDALEAALLVCG